MAESSGKKRKVASGAEEDDENGGKKAVRMYASACQFCRRRKVSSEERERRAFRRDMGESDPWGMMESGWDATAIAGLPVCSGNPGSSCGV
jgi:hypothetical protein